MHVPRRRRQTTQSTAYTATRHWQPGRHTYVYGAAAMRAIPVPGLPDSSIRARGRRRGLLGETCVHCIACIMHGSLASRARAACTHTHCSRRGTGAGTCIAAARPASGRAARAAGPGLVRCICMAWTPGRRGQLLLCLQQRAGGLGQSSERLFGSEAFHFSSEESKGVSQTLFVRMNELA